MNDPLPLPAPGEIHLWVLDLDLDDEQAAQLLRILDPNERERAARLIIPRGRRRFIAARGQLRRVLASYLSAQPEELSFRYGPHGKPELSPPRDVRLCFNLSHSGDLALLALNLDHPIGVDIERKNPERPFLELSERFFSPSERETLRGLPEHLRTEAFYACWTRKEAYIKAIGTGLATPLNAFDVTLAPSDPPALTRQRIDPNETRRWHLADVPVPDGYRAAVATEWHNPFLYTRRHRSG